MRGSTSYGSGNRRLRKELEVLLTSRYEEVRSDEGIIYDEGRRARALCIIDALLDLRQRKELSGVVESLEIAGVLSVREARHFLGIGACRQISLEEAERPLPAGPPPTRRTVYPAKRNAAYA